jgi:hypothetical protein
MSHRLIGALALALLAPALYWTLRIEQADWHFVKGDAASIRRAIQLAPGTAEYYSGLAEAEPDHAVEVLREAAALNPQNGSLRVELGVAEERAGDFATAEARLLEAARLDRGFAPRSALSDFYFHRRDTEKFWPVAKDALSVSSGDVTDLFRDAWGLTSDSQPILDMIPDRPAVLRQYLDFLVMESRLDAAVPVAGRVLASADRQSVPVLLQYCDHMLAEWRGEEAADVCLRFAPNSGRGFDWQISTPDGIAADRTPDGIVLTFTGRQPENTELVSQFVPLLPNRAYTLRVEYQATGIVPESGIECAIYLKDGRDLLHGRGTLQPAFTFHTPANASLGRIVLGYHRALGTTRAEGMLTLRKFDLRLAE